MTFQRLLHVLLLGVLLPSANGSSQSCIELAAGKAAIDAPGAVKVDVFDATLEKHIASFAVDKGKATIDSDLIKTTFTNRSDTFLLFCTDAACDPDHTTTGKVRFKTAAEKTSCDELYGSQVDPSQKQKFSVSCPGAIDSKTAHYTDLVFGPDGGLCSWTRTFSVEQDPIRVSAYKLKDVPVTMQIEGCSLAPVIPPILISGSLPGATTKSANTERELKTFPIQQCSGRSLTIVLNDFPEKGKTTRYSIQQYLRYRGTLQFGVSFTNQQDPTFALRSTGGKNYIYSQGPTDTGPEYLANVVIYGLPRYLMALGKGKPNYYGRDVINDNTFSDRLGGVIGVGLNRPGDRFVTGLSFEILYGVNALGLVEFAKVKELDGVKVGDEFTGAADQVPTRAVWANKIVFGLSIDLRYVGLLFSGGGQ